MFALSICSQQPPEQLTIHSILKKKLPNIKKKRSCFDCCKELFEDCGDCCIDDGGSFFLDKNGNPTVCCLSVVPMMFIGGAIGAAYDSFMNERHHSHTECCGALTTAIGTTLFAYAAKDYANTQKAKRKHKAHFE